MIVHGLANCDRCRAAKRALEAAGIAAVARDVRKAPPDRAEIERWRAALGEALINRKSATWRGLDPEQRARAETDPAGLLLDHPSAIKRPVIEAGGAFHATVEGALASR